MRWGFLHDNYNNGEGGEGINNDRHTNIANTPKMRPSDGRDTAGAYDNDRTNDNNSKPTPTWNVPR